MGRGTGLKAIFQALLVRCNRRIETSRLPSIITTSPSSSCCIQHIHIQKQTQSIKLISTTSTTHPVNNEILNLYSEGVMLSKCIHEGRLTTTKPTFVALPSLTSHSTFHECSRGIPCQPQDSPHSPLTRRGVIISYSLHLERKITLPSTSIIRWNTTTDSTLKKLIYSTSRNPTTFQVGICSSISLIKSTLRLLKLT